MSAELIHAPEVEPASIDHTFAVLADDLATYYETLDMIEAAAPSEDYTEADILRDRMQVQTSIDRVSAELMKKSDAIAAVRRRLISGAEYCKKEKARIAARQKAGERALDRLDAYVVRVMQERGIKTLRTASNTLSLRTSDAVVITDEAAIPAGYKRATVVISELAWRLIAELHPELVASARHEVECQKAVIKAAIKAGGAVAGADLETRDNLQVR